jgi:uncharacterized protein
VLKRARVWDPLYGRIDFSRFEYDLISLPEVQRLRNVRMCNINSMLVTGASEISRFEHTIGVLRLTQEWIRHHQITDYDAKQLSAAAVLHDMQTGPFGHSLQYVLEDNEVEGDFIHEDINHGKNNYYHQDLFANASFCGRPFGAEVYLGGRWEGVGNIIKGAGLFGPLIAGTMDLDNIDNVVRLAYHVGVASNADADIALSLARDIGLDNGGISFSRQAIQKIVRWQRIREDLYNLLLLDWAEFSAKAMLTRAMEIAIANGVVGADSWVHTDSELFSVLEHGIGEAQAAAELVKRLRSGELYEPLALLVSPSIEVYDNLSSVEFKKFFESDISKFLKELGGEGANTIVHFILDKGKTRRAVKIKMRDSGEFITVGENSKNLLIGVFRSRGGVSQRIFPALTERIKLVLGEHGVQQIQPIDDPMGEVGPTAQSNEQLVLL